LGQLVVVSMSSSTGRTFPFDSILSSWYSG